MFDHIPSTTVTIMVPRSDVETCDVDPTVAALQPFVSSPERARSLQGSLDLRIGGYDDDRFELYEIEDVRTFVHALDLQFPYWLYFSNLDTASLRMLTLCFLPPFLTDEGKRKHFNDDLGSLLERRWMPALEQMASYTRYSEGEFEEVVDAVAGYYHSPASALTP